MKCVRFSISMVAMAVSICLLCGALVSGQQPATETKPAQKKADAKSPDKKPAKRAAKKPEESSTVVPNSRGEKWLPRHNTIVARVKKGDVDLIFVGDSITQGWESKGKAVWEKYYAKRHAANLGISGDRTQHVLWRLDNGEIDGIKPKLAVIMIGTNNSSQNSPEDIAAGVKAIVGRIQKRLPETKVLLLAIFPRGEDAKNKQRQVNEKTNAIFAKLADEKTVYYLDIGPKFLDKDGKLPKDVMPDLLHPNAKGYEIWAQAIEPSIVKLMGEK